MLKETFGKKYSLAVLLSVSSLLVTFTALTMKAKIFEVMAVSIGARNLKIGIYLLVSYFLLQMISAVLNITKDRIQRKLKIEVLSILWDRTLPSRISQEATSRAGDYFQSLFLVGPQYYDFKFLYFVELSQALSIAAFFVYRVYADSFYWALLFVPFLVFGSVLSGKFQENKYKNAKIESHTQRAAFQNKLNKYFKNFTELYLNWNLNEKSNQKRVTNEIFTKAYNSLIKLEKVVFSRELMGFGIVDFPYILGIACIFLFTLFGKLSIKECVVWIGVVDFLVRANSNLRNVIQYKIEMSSSKSSFEKLNDKLAIKDIEHENNLRPTEQLALTLLDKTELTIQPSPGIYKIKGSNGSGKSTMLYSLVGALDVPDSLNTKNFKLWRSYFKTRALWVSSKSETIFDGDSLWKELNGDESSYSKDLLIEKIRNTFSEPTASFWIYKVENLSTNFTSRQWKNLSEGERVVLSFFRAIVNSTTHHELIVCDESESSLDQETKLFFRKSLLELSKNYIVLWVSHDSLSSASKSLATRAHLLGYSQTQHKAQVIPFVLKLSYPGQGKTIVNGKFACEFTNILERAKQAYLHTHPNFKELKNGDLFFQCDADDVKVNESLSSGLAFSVALANLNRIANNKQPVLPVAATGQVSIDGGVEEVSYLEEKKLAAHKFGIKFIVEPQSLNTVSSINEYLDSLAMTEDRKSKAYI